MLDITSGIDEQRGRAAEKVETASAAEGLETQEGHETTPDQASALNHWDGADPRYSENLLRR